MDRQRIVWYFADPLCSWCWGFAPVIDAIRDTYGAGLEIGLILGGLRPGTTEPVTATFREDILRHWREVERRTGQHFAFDRAMPEGFIYDTEPPSRALVAMAEINPAAMLSYLKSIQAAFYLQCQDVTKPEVLSTLAQHYDVEPARFLELFRSQDVQRKTQTHFQQSRQAGIVGFPTVVLQNGADYTLLTRGYRPFSDIKPEIDAWLAASK